MIWQRICLAAGLVLGLVLGGAFLSQGALAQTSDPANDPGAAAAPTDDPGRPRKKSIIRSPQSAGNGGPKVIVDVDLSSQSMHVQFPDGTDETWPIASGRPGLDTPDGKYKPQWVDPDHVSKQYQDAPMPYAIFFDLKGHAIHGSYQKKFGAAVSHGCVRISVDNAKKLFEAVKVSGAEIDITGRAPRRGGYWAQRQPQGYPQAQYGDGYGGHGIWARADPAILGAHILPIRGSARAAAVLLRRAVRRRLSCAGTGLWQTRFHSCHGSGAFRLLGHLTSRRASASIGLSRGWKVAASRPSGFRADGRTSPSMTPAIFLAGSDVPITGSIYEQGRRGIDGFVAVTIVLAPLAKRAGLFRA